MKIMDSDVFYKKYIEKDFDEYYVPHIFENICRQYLIRKTGQESFSHSGFSCGKRDDVVLITLEDIFA